MRPAPAEFVKKISDNEQRPLNETSRRGLARIQPMNTQVLGNTGMEDLVWGMPVSLKKAAE